MGIVAHKQRLFDNCLCWIFLSYLQITRYQIMPTYTQDERLISVTTPLGTDVLLLAKFSGRSEMSRLFEYTLDMFSENNAIDAQQIVGQTVTFSIKRPDDTVQYFNGMVNRFSAGSETSSHLVLDDGTYLRHYQATVVPSIWTLTKKKNCRIFQNMTVPDILGSVLAGYSYESKLQGSYTPWIYCVQYRETDFAFISRLMEHEGIYYYFTHENGSHKLVLADATSSYYSITDNNVEYSDEFQEWKGLTDWSHTIELRSGKWTHRDYNSTTPSTKIEGSTDTICSIASNNVLEIYDYPGKVLDVDEATTESKIRMQEEEVGYDVVKGDGAYTSFSPGGKFTLTEHPCSNEKNKGYVITYVEHSASEGSYFPKQEVATRYENTFRCIPDNVLFRPARITPKPIIPGPQTAVVVGPAGSEIYHRDDKYFGVKVQFFWDRLGQFDENSSCWIRVAQIWAGKRWGASFWPRIGQEVVVEFLEGDPDRPLVTGMVYNHEQLPPYMFDGPDQETMSDPLIDHPMVSGIKSNTSIGGEGFNEIRFNDTVDKQQLFLHAERNMDVRVKNDSMEQVLSNRHLIVGQADNTDLGDQIELINRDKHLNVKRNQIEKIEGNLQLYIGGGDDGGNVDIVIAQTKKEKVTQDVHTTIDGKRNQKIGGDASLEITGARKDKIGGDDNQDVGGDRNQSVGGNESLDVSSDINVKAGSNYAVEGGSLVYIKSGATLVLEASSQLSLKVGGNLIDISASGISIVGSMVNINSGGSAGSGSGPSPTAPTSPDAPEAAAEAQPTAPTEADDAVSGSKSCSDG